MSRKIFAEKDNYNCIVYKKVMSIKLVLRYFKLFIYFYLHAFFQHLHVELYTLYTCTITNNYMYVSYLKINCHDLTLLSKEFILMF